MWEVLKVRSVMYIRAYVCVQVMDVANLYLPYVPSKCSQQALTAEGGCI